MNIRDLFFIDQFATSLKVELNAGATAWLTMVYIAAVNPAMLAQTGMDAGAVFVATCSAAAFGSIMMGAITNYPIALAPGMGLNAFFTFGIVLGSGYPWQTALTAVFFSGILFFLLTIIGVRELIVNAIPRSLKSGCAIGIGLFLAVIGLQSAGIIQSNSDTLISLGDLTTLPAVLAALGFFVIVGLHVRGKPWAVIAGVLGIALLGWVFDPNAQFNGIFSAPPSIAPTFLQLQFDVPIDLVFATLVISLLFVDFFDTSGTLLAVMKASGLEADGRTSAMGKAMKADSLATIVGSLLGTSTTTSYIESTAGIMVGGKTGITAIVVGALFLFTLFMFPLVSSIPAYATAPALVFVSILLIRTLSDFNDWADFSETAPLIITATMMPLSFSIADGLAMGCISYVGIKILSGKLTEIHPVVAGLATAFILRFVFL